MTINQIFNIPQLNIKRVTSENDNIQIYASIKSKKAQCPTCNKYSNSIHDNYERNLTDLPILNSKTEIILRTRKFKCKNAQCHQKVFSEQIPFVAKYARRTKRVSNKLDTLSIELTSKQGSMLSEEFRIKVSPSTITRMAHKQPLPPIKQPKILGVDDWAYRKGVSYGTILIDMETSKPIDVLESREGDDLKDWLKKYKDIKVVTRDRASAYCAAITEICPNTVQVADRFHLLMNLSDALDKYFKFLNPKINELIKSKTNELLDNTINKTSIQNNTFKIQKIDTDKCVSKTKIDQREVIFKKLKELQEQNVAIKKISRDLGISRGTVRSYFQYTTLPPKSYNKQTNIDLFTEHIIYRLNENVSGKEIINEIKELGYDGSQTQAYYNINIIKEKYNLSFSKLGQLQTVKIPFVKPLTTRELAKTIGASFTSIKEISKKEYLKTLLENLPELKIVRKLVIIFKTMFWRGKGNIERWINFIKKSKYKLTGLTSFANGLMSDIKAVKNGINLHWSNGAVEGHVNRIKSKKRQMYGRAKFDLLRRKIILSQTG
ncbi:ISL3 family transposase [Plebeiibacterium sediminum]|uniref:ISL3 family transposase n=1 Tax=Plebeiibacterium sediminum TaxID=2992112 RepID=A0AAE3M9E9_9BACT|nr:ISL3 family transposase [Plebeiobacterium sediminum]MCW3789689.1 ISL3 family transposase [Plebeiobacterium sediminum]